jgi:predicted phosphoribosyltransferase
MRFRNRAEAGRLLAERLREYAERDDLIVLALPRGGVPVGYEVARSLGAGRCSGTAGSGGRGGLARGPA